MLDNTLPETFSSGENSTMISSEHPLVQTESEGRTFTITLNIAYLKNGDTKNFAQFLPMSLRPHSAEIIAMFKNEMSENLLKVYLKEMLKECKILF